MKRNVDQQHSTLWYFQWNPGVFEFLPNTRCCSGYSSCLTGRVTRFTLARSPARVLGSRFCTFTISIMKIMIMAMIVKIVMTMIAKMTSPAHDWGRRFCIFTISTMIIFMIDEDDYHHGSKDRNDGADGCHRPLSGGNIDFAPLLHPSWSWS